MKSLVIEMLGKRGSGEPMPAMDSQESDVADKEIAAKALAKALKSGDPASIVTAFEAMMSCCGEPDMDDEHE